MLSFKVLGSRNYGQHKQSHKWIILKNHNKCRWSICKIIHVHICTHHWLKHLKKSFQFCCGDNAVFVFAIDFEHRLYGCVCTVKKTKHKTTRPEIQTKITILWSWLMWTMWLTMCHEDKSSKATVNKPSGKPTGLATFISTN